MLIFPESSGQATYLQILLFMGVDTRAARPYYYADSIYKTLVDMCTALNTVHV